MATIVEMKGSESGFTLVELLISMVIVGILSAIATGHFTFYKNSAYEARAEQDLRNAVTAQESFFIENEAYTACAESACNTTLPGYQLSPDTSIVLTVRDNNQNFDGVTSHPKAATSYSYSSDVGEIISS